MSPAELEAVSRQSDRIAKSTEHLKGLVMEPTVKRHSEAIDLITGFVAKNRRLLYGGFAWQLLEEAGSSGQPPAPPQYMDVDFHSSTPIHDVKTLCDNLHGAGFKDVNAKNSIHEETYSIFLGAQKCCDISYMPKMVVARLPVMLIKGYHIVHPKIMTIDVLKMLCTPVHSFWRLERTICRAQALFERHPIAIREDLALKAEPLTGDRPLAAQRAARDVMLHQCGDSLMWVGAAAIEAYETNTDQLDDRGDTVLEAISVNFVSDVDRVVHSIATATGPPVVYTFQSFLGYMGKHVAVCLDGQVVARIFDGANQGFTYRDAALSGVPIRVATFCTLVYHLLVLNLHAYTQRNPLVQGCTNMDLLRLLKARPSFDGSDPDVPPPSLDENGVFAEFQARCHGITNSAHHAYLLRQIMKRVRTMSAMSSYRPGSPKASGGKVLHPDAYRFKNSSGNLVIVSEGDGCPWRRGD